MNGRIIAIGGKAGAGKDTIADYLVSRHGFVKIGFADPMKRFCREVFDFSDEQLFGASEHRDAPDTRYVQPFPHDMSSGRPFILTPRYALQRLGTEWGRDCYPNVWVDYAIMTAQSLLCGECAYQQDTGLEEGLDNWPAPAGVVIPDARFINEFEAVRRAAGGECWRVKRPGTVAGDHASELEADSLDDEFFDGIIDNGGRSLESLWSLIDNAMACSQ